MIVIAGEALIDMVANKSTPEEFSAIPGGAAYNVACALGLLRLNPGFICPLSEDTLGQVLLNHLQACGAEYVLTELVEAPTPLAMVTIDHKGQANYQFYREGTADRRVNQIAMDQIAPENTRILHITGICLNDSEDFQHWLALVKSVKHQGRLISVDPNVRPGLIEDEQDYRNRIHQLMDLADIVKVSDEDLTYLFPEISLEQAKKVLEKMAGLSIITCGSKGAEARWQGNCIFIEANKVSKLVDTVGAGDCFSAGYLYSLHECGISSPEQLQDLLPSQASQLLSFASKVAAINCTRKGCQPPTLQEVS